MWRDSGGKPCFAFVLRNTSLRTRPKGHPRMYGHRGHRKTEGPRRVLVDVDRDRVTGRK
jgi:hypothetical protein